MMCFVAPAKIAGYGSAKSRLSVVSRVVLARHRPSFPDLNTLESEPVVMQYRGSRTSSGETGLKKRTALVA